jgi:hypothetical protein
MFKKVTIYLISNYYIYFYNNINITNKKEEIKMVCSVKSKKSGKMYYLHQKGHLTYFSGDPKGAIDLPAGYTIIENKKTGLPMVKKK